MKIRKKKSNLINLYEEICQHCKISDIHYVVIADNEWSASYVNVDLEWFLKQAKRIDYDAGYGGEVINMGLKIVLKDGNWLERETYDGAEGFCIKSKPPCIEEEAECDIAILFRNKHGCSYNATIDGHAINRKLGDYFKSNNDKKYAIWLEKKGKIVIELHNYTNDGNYKPEHISLMK